MVNDRADRVTRWGYLRSCEASAHDTRLNRDVVAIKVLPDLFANDPERGARRRLGVATDHVIESFRNRLWRGYKTSEGIEPDLLSQFPLLEDTITNQRARHLLPPETRWSRGGCVTARAVLQQTK